MYVALTWPQKKEEKIDTGYQQPLLTKCCSPKAAVCSQYTSDLRASGVFDSTFTLNGEAIPHKEQTRYIAIAREFQRGGGLVLSGM